MFQVSIEVAVNFVGILVRTTMNNNPDAVTEINPASCLPMVGTGKGGLDTDGNPYGLKFERDDVELSMDDLVPFDDDLFGDSSFDW
jgi:hypothetical protein